MSKLFSKTTLILSVLMIAIIVAGFTLPFPAGAQSVTPDSSPWNLAQSHPWSFGVLPDTQWTVPDDGYNPNTVPANIVKQIDQQFAKSGVKFVVAVGDTVDVSTKTNIDTRALYSQDLYNAGIGFYPLRGNHESEWAGSAAEFQYAYPQIGTGVNNNTPAAITNSIIPAADLANNPPAPKAGRTFTTGSNFSLNTNYGGLSYSFQYNGDTFLLLDQFDATGNTNNSTIAQQQDWINQTLSGRPANTQAFVFTHKNLLGGNHKDNMFGPQVGSTDPGDGNGVNIASLSTADQATLAAKQAAENNFIASMQANNVPLVISGHDHHDYFSQVTSPDGKSKVDQLITQSASSKFYTPVLPVSANDVPIREDLYRVGYYIFTVDGPNVTVDYYGDSTGGQDYGLNGGTFDFVKMATLNYSLNGKQNLVAQGGSYTMTDNTTMAANMEKGFKGTTMSILAGTNGNLLTTNYGVKISNDVTTGWSPAESNLSSDILTLAGMSRSLGSDKTDEYVLSMSYVPGPAVQALLKNGNFGILTRDSFGRWVNAASKDFAVNQKFVSGPWNSTFKLGAYGVDTATNTAWAVLNYNGDFAVGQAPSLGH